MSHRNLSESYAASCPNPVCGKLVVENKPYNSNGGMKFKCTCGCVWSMGYKYAARTNFLQKDDEIDRNQLDLLDII